jgi:hypothetical protein
MKLMLLYNMSFLDTPHEVNLHIMEQPTFKTAAPPAAFQLKVVTSFF